MRIVLAVLFLLMIAVTQVKAVTTVRQYKSDIAAGGRGADFTRIYIYGLGEGFATANAEAINKKAAPFFCAPERMPLTIDNYTDILERQIRARIDRGATESEVDKIWISVLLLWGLEETFPCKGK